MVKGQKNILFFSTIISLLLVAVFSYRVSDDYERVNVPSNASIPQTALSIEEYMRANNFSSPEECRRECNGSNYNKTCYYSFYLEYYATLTRACDSCTPNKTNHCQCILADGVERTVASVNRMIPGPSIELCQGDNIIVDVQNRMEGSEVTIHWHGVHQLETSYYDGVPYVTQCPILSANTFRYVWKATNAGTHFWHSHSAFQKMDGVAGSLIIRQERDRHSNLYDFDKSEHVIFIQDWMHRLTTDAFPGRRFGLNGQPPNNFLINGKGFHTNSSVELELERFVVTPGRKYRFRLINAFASNCPVQIMVEGHDLTVIATDGEPVIPVQVGSIISASAERYDFVIDANKEPRSYWIQLKGLEQCARLKINQLAVLEYNPGSGVMTTAPTFDESIPSLKVLNPLDSNCQGERQDAICVSQLSNAAENFDSEILTANPDVKIVLTFGFHAFGDEELFFSNTFKKFFVTSTGGHLAGLLDNISYVSPPSPLVSQFHELDPGIFCNGDQTLTNCGGICRCTHLIQIPLNSTVELILIDQANNPGIHHPFHLHGHSFYVLGDGHLPQGDYTIMEIVEMNRMARQSDFPPAKDTITIPSAGYVILRFRANNPGFWLLHCHFLFHIITGMSAVLQVGDLSEFPPVPHNFPRCGNFL